VLARHLEEFGKEIVRALRRHLSLLAPLFRYGFGLGDGFLQRGNIGFQGRDAFNCCIGFLAPPFAPDFGLCGCLSESEATLPALRPAIILFWRIWARSA
jgi:hypothetical protein